MSRFKKIDPRISLSVLFACVLTVIAACVNSSAPIGAPNVIDPPTVSSVRITLAQSTLSPGQTTQATAVATSADGKIIGGRVDFSSESPSIALVSSQGVVTAVAPGPAIIQASISGVTGLDTLVVVVPPNLASTDFTNAVLTGNPGGQHFEGTPGTFQFLYQAGRFSIVDDPTGSGRGKVGQFFYLPIASNLSDDEVINPSIVSRPVPVFRYGYTLWFKGDVYFPSANSSGVIHNHNGRKFLDYKGNGIRMVLHKLRDDNGGYGTVSEDPANSHSAVHMSIVQYVNGTAQETMDPYCGFGLLDDTWYTLEVMVKTNSADGVSDGVVEIYINGAATPAYRRDTGLHWITEVPVATQFDFLMIGSQLTESSSDLFSEYRYWDNVAFSTTRIGR
jgi:hypothetical protein